MAQGQQSSCSADQQLGKCCRAIAVAPHSNTVQTHRLVLPDVLVKRSYKGRQAEQRWCR